MNIMMDQEILGPRVLKSCGYDLQVQARPDELPGIPARTLEKEPYYESPGMGSQRDQTMD
jgi:hypothetical protein